MLEMTFRATTRIRQLAGVALAFTVVFALGACNDTRPQRNITGPSLSERPENGHIESDDDDNGDDDDTVYEQVEFLRNPLVSEVTIVKANQR